MKSDAMLRKDVCDEIEFDPKVMSEHVGVSVDSGIVTLAGTVSSYAEKTAAERAAQRVEGVRGVVDRILVKVPGTLKKSDEEIALAIAKQFQWNVRIPDEKIKISVEDGRVTLRGEVEWQYQRREAEAVTRMTTGVCDINNHITMKPRAQIKNIQKRIEDALRREAERAANRITVSVKGGDVTLTGTADSYTAVEDAKWAAWSAPGVKSVTNNLTVI